MTSGEAAALPLQTCAVRVVYGLSRAPGIWYFWAVFCTSVTRAVMAWYSLSASPNVALNWLWASMSPWISSMVCTMNMSTRSSQAPSNQLLKGCGTSTHCCSLGKLQVQLVNLLQQLLCLLECIAASSGEGAKTIPLVTDGLAAGVDGGRVIVIKGIELLGNGCNLLHTVLKNMKKVGQKPFLKGLLTALQVLPGIGNVCDSLPLRGQVRQGVVGLAGLKPGQCAADPFQKVRGETLIFFHQPLILLVDLEHLADAVGSHFRLTAIQDSMTRTLSASFLTYTHKSTIQTLHSHLHPQEYYPNFSEFLSASNMDLHI
ncbi:hypothetical protein E2C01_023290 [Portunus trituberculatus]|uniref:Uncharacterized protein n=1 Tax=Portunus trituberculatus TaxID=210409 RepID=A0A5B7EA04_PORTR|nr:hypothetical protein [Portunus trituberculatus]